MKYERLLLLIASAFIFTNVTSAQFIREIIPMHSNCSDVKNVLKVGTCRKDHEVYVFPDEFIQVGYSTEKCQTAYGEKWDIPTGTVISVVRIFRKVKLLNTLGIDTSKCEKVSVESDVPDLVIYSCKDIGVSVTAVNDIVGTLTYLPTPEDRCLICK